LDYECKIYKLLDGIVGFPTIHHMGIEGDYNAMIMDLLGPSIADLLKYCKNRFTIKTTAMLADAMIDRL
jgi:hypothetical protein